jgi:hypothetical protein
VGEGGARYGFSCDFGCCSIDPGWFSCCEEKGFASALGVHVKQFFKWLALQIIRFLDSVARRIGERVEVGWLCKYLHTISLSILLFSLS